MIPMNTASAAALACSLFLFPAFTQAAAAVMNFDHLILPLDRALVVDTPYSEGGLTLGTNHS